MHFATFLKFSLKCALIRATCANLKTSAPRAGVPKPFSLNYIVRGAAAPWGLYDKGALTKKV